jgi:protein SCO1/2
MRFDSISLVAALAVVLGLGAVSCSKETGPGGASGTNAPATSGSSTNPRIYQVKGVLKEIRHERKKALIEHEDIPGYMEAMTMLLDVRDTNEFTGLVAGDSITFRMLVTEDDGWIDQLKKVDGPRTPLASQPSTFRPVRDVEPLVVGDKMPEYVFTNSFGKELKLSSLKGRAYAFTFIFTRCPFPTFCPRLNSHFEAVQKSLLAMTNGPTNWTLLSITIDPDFDTPAQLKNYSTRYSPDPNHWQWLTAPLIDITAIGEQFGLQFWRANPAEPINHNVRTVVVDAAGVVHWVTPDNEFKPDMLVEQLVKAAKAKPAP